MAAFTNGTWTPGASENRPTTPVNSDQRALVVAFNELLERLSGILAVFGGADVPVTTGSLAIGSSDTNISTTAQAIAINGVTTVVAAQTNQATGALGTVPADTWAIVGVERVAAGTTTFTSGAANYTTGYATEALAIAALPAQTADRVRIGYITVLTADGQDFIFGTDAFEGGATGNPATTTNYYNTDGVADTATWAGVEQIGNEAGTVITSTVG